MNWKPSVLFVLAFLFVFPKAGFAQYAGPQPNPDLTQLIEWSQLQDPQPIQPASADAQEQPSAQTQPAQTMTGTVVKEDGRYVLKTLNRKTYQIDEQDKAKEYEGKQVKIVGSLDVSTSTIRIQSIELVS